MLSRARAHELYQFINNEFTKIIENKNIIEHRTPKAIPHQIWTSIKNKRDRIMAKGHNMVGIRPSLSPKVIYLA